jgi:hypothetical protein
MMMTMTMMVYGSDVQSVLLRRYLMMKKKIFLLPVMLIMMLSMTMRRIRLMMVEYMDNYTTQLILVASRVN